MRHFYIVVNTEYSYEINEALKENIVQMLYIVGEDHLNLSRLDRIIISQYFDKELEHLSLFTAGRQPITYTNNDHAVAAGKIITLTDTEENFIKILVLSEYFINLMLQDIKSAIHLLHHELLHIHDFNETDKAIPLFNRKRLTSLENHYLPTVLSTWDEYYANRMATPTITDTWIELSIQTFLSYLQNTEENIVQKRFLYQIGQIDLETFYHKYFIPYAQGQYLATAYLIGYCHGLGKTLDEISPETFNVLESHLFKPIYTEMGTILNNMLKSYPSEWDENIYDDLIQNFLLYYSKLGLSLEQEMIPECRVKINIFFPD